MKNIVECKNCQAQNSFYALTCSNCKAYLRDRVYNIDFGSMLLLLLDSPTAAFKKIVYAEHKNFIFVILLLSSVQLFILSIFTQLYFTKGTSLLENPFKGLIYFVIIFGILVFVFSLSMTYLNYLFGLSTRIKDNFAVLIYSLLPLIAGILVVFPVELIVFGKYLFDVNPGPFQLKEGLAYMLLAIEALIVITCFVLNGFGNFVQSKNVLYSLLLDIFFFAVVFGYLYVFGVVFK